MPDLEKVSQITASKRRVGTNKRGQQIKGTGALAAEVYADLENQELQDNTKVSYKGLLLSGLRGSLDLLEDSSLKGRVKTTIDYLADDLALLFKGKQQATNSENKFRTVARREGAIEYDPTPLIEKAYDVLQEVAHGFEPNWADVAFALVVATGRRSVEIMMTGQFWLPTEEEITWEPELSLKNYLKTIKSYDPRIKTRSWLIDKEHTIGFKGLAKGKGKQSKENRELVFYITTLVPAELVMKGFQYLIDKDVRLDIEYGTVYVNRKYSNSFQRKKKQWPLPMKPAVNGKAETEFSIHDIRDIYFCSLVATLKVPPRDYRYITGVMGHFDQSTIESYETVFIKEGTTTFI